MARTPSIGTIGFTAEEFQEIVMEVVDEAEEARQAAYDTVMEVLGEVVTGKDAMALVGEIDLPRLMAERPDEARKLLREVREGLEEES